MSTMNAGSDVSTVEMDTDFQRVCDLDDLWRGEMAVHDVRGVKVLVCHTESGLLRAVQLMCPHQSFALSEGELAGDTLICTKHMWEFDLGGGCGINPTGVAVALYPVKVVDDQIFVSVKGVAPKHAKP